MRLGPIIFEIWIHSVVHSCRHIYEPYGWQDNCNTSGTYTNTYTRHTNYMYSSKPMPVQSCLVVTRYLHMPVIMLAFRVSGRNSYYITHWLILIKLLRQICLMTMHTMFLSRRLWHLTIWLHLNGCSCKNSNISFEGCECIN